jgi:hypothetical protein
VVADPANGVVGQAEIQAAMAVAEVLAVAHVPAAAAVYAPLTPMQALMAGAEVKQYYYQRSKLTENVKKAFAIVLKQSTPALKNKLEERPEWAALKVSCDVLQLLELIRSFVFKYEDRMYQPLSLHEATQNFYGFRQGNMSNADYLQSFKNRLEMASSHGVVLFHREIAVMLMRQTPADAHKDFESEDPGNLTPDEREAYLKQSKEVCQAIAFLAQSDMKRYGDLLLELQNDYTKGVVSYPKTLTKAHQYLNDYKGKPVAQGCQATDECPAMLSSLLLVFLFFLLLRCLRLILTV